jgi:hypothetical protein
MGNLKKYINHRVDKLICEIATEQKLLSGDINLKDYLIIDSFKEALISLIENNK